MAKALLVRRYGSLTPALQKKLFPGWKVVSVGGVLWHGPMYDTVVIAFVEETQMEMEWVELARTRLNKGGKFIRIA